MAADLPNLFCDRYPTYQYTYGDCTFTALPIVRKSTVSIYPMDFRCICKRNPTVFAQEIGKFFALTALDLFNWIMNWRVDDTTL